MQNAAHGIMAVAAACSDARVITVPTSAIVNACISELAWAASAQCELCIGEDKACKWWQEVKARRESVGTSARGESVGHQQERCGSY